MLFKCCCGVDLVYILWSYVDFDYVFECVFCKNVVGNSNVFMIFGEYGLIS